MYHFDFLLMISILIVLTFWAFDDNFPKKCEDAGGVPVHGKCFNPSVFIKV